tara:strand:+ start:3005 stop:3766 length:762 start_codon:yes stop_codon:yes gene_type:complete
MLIHCKDCELKDKCNSFGSTSCDNYTDFEFRADVVQLIEDERTKELIQIPDGHELVSVQTNKNGDKMIITNNEEGNLVLPPNFSLDECHLCNRVDFTLDYKWVAKGTIWACSKCASAVTEIDEHTNQLIDALFKAEEFARKSNANPEIAGIIYTLNNCIKEVISNQDANPLMVLHRACQHIGHEQAKKMLSKLDIIDKKDSDKFDVGIPYASNENTDDDEKVVHIEHLKDHPVTKRLAEEKDKLKPNAWDKYL